MKTSNEIDDYLMGNLSEEQKEQFSAEIKENEDLANSVLLHEEVNESITDNEIFEFRAKIKKLMSDNNKIKKLKAVHYISSIAAVFLIALSIAALLKNPDYSKTFITYYRPYETDLNVRSESTKAEGLDFALILYQKGEYQAAFELLQNYNQSVYNNYTAQFYYGLSAMELDKFDIAEESLQEVLTSDDPSLKLHAKWYLGLLYLQTEQAVKAKNIFNELSEDDNYYARKVKKILKKLN